MKNRKKVSLGVLLIIVCYSSSFAQDTYNFTQFYFNQALLNPSYTGSDGRLALYASYRKQWVGIEGAPTLGNFSIQSAMPNRVNIGFNASNDKNGLISTSGVLLTGGYSLPLTNLNYLRFGISIGGAWNKVDVNALRFSTASDPVQANLLASNGQVVGNVGFSFHTPTFHVGLAVPSIFEPVYLSSDAFSVSKINPFASIIAHASNRFYFAKDKNIFEPYLVYRYNQNAPSQIEAAAILHLQNLVWVGGSFKQNYGISAVAGFKLKGLTAVGYSYTLKNSGTNQLSAPSHEIHIGLMLGAKVKKIPVYSFVDTEKEKVKQKTPQQLAADKKKHDAEVAKKKEEDQKKQELARAEAERKKAEEQAKAEEKRKAEELAKAEEQRKAEELAKAEEKKKAEELAAQQKKVEPKKEEVKPVVEAVVVTQAIKPDSSLFEKRTHNGGPRLRASTAIVETETDSARLAEEAHLKRLEEHADDPNALHGLENDAHPHAERHEFVKQGGHQSELEIGDYVIAGVFKMEENAKKYSDGLLKLGFKDSDYGYLTQNNLWYVHIAESNDLDVIRQHRDKFRKMKIFREAWLLTVHR